MDQRRNEGNIILPGASVPIQANARILIMFGVILSQAYLAAVAQMALRSSALLPPGSARDRAPWIALSNESLPAILWSTSLAIPLFSVGFAGFYIASLHLSTEEGRWHNAAVLGSFLCFLVSAGLVVWTSRVTRDLAFRYLRAGYRRVVVRTLLKMFSCGRKIENWSERRKYGRDSHRVCGQIQHVSCDGGDFVKAAFLFMLMRYVGRI